MQGRNVLLALGGSAMAACCYSKYVRPWQQNWGARPGEIEAQLPGDDLVVKPWMRATRAISIEAPPEAIWPWLVQMGGYTRGGWYSRDWIDNGGRPSAERIIPELQSLQLGDVMATSADDRGFTVVAIDPPRTLVLAIREPQITISSVYALISEGSSTTRLINRVCLRPHRSVAAFLLWLGMDTGELYMTRPMLLGIKRRAECLQLEAGRQELGRARTAVYERS